MKMFKVVSELKLKGKKVLVLSQKLTMTEYRKKRILCGEKKYSYGLTHNDYQIWIDTNDSFLNKLISFV